MVIRLVLLFFFVASGMVVAASSPARAAETWLVGGAFQAELEKPCVAIFQDKPIRDALRDLARQLRVALVLDRRVDPTRPVSLDGDRLSLREALASLAAQQGLGLAELGDTLYLGPAETARVLKTAAEIQRLAIASLPAARRVDLARARPVAWQDLESSSEVLTRLGRAAGIKVLNPEAVPEDLLWGEAFGNASAVEALALFLAQFGLGYEWPAAGASIRLVPFRNDLSVRRSHAVTDDRKGEILKLAGEAWPDLEIAQQKGSLEFAGLVEQHEMLEQWIRPSKPAGNSRPVKPAGDLSKKRLTFRVVQTPARDVLKNLEVTGLSFVVEESVDLDTRLSFELKDAPISRVIEEIASQLKAEASLDKTVVRMRPKPQ